MKIQYKIINNYYLTVIEKIKLIIKAYNKTCISIWIYNHNTDEELLGKEYSSLHKILKTKLQLDIEVTKHQRIT